MMATLQQQQQHTTWQMNMATTPPQQQQLLAYPTVHNNNNNNMNHNECAQQQQQFYTPSLSNNSTIHFSPTNNSDFHFSFPTGRNHCASAGSSSLLPDVSFNHSTIMMLSQLQSAHDQLQSVNVCILQMIQFNLNVNTLEAIQMNAELFSMFDQNIQSMNTINLNMYHISAQSNNNSSSNSLIPQIGTNQAIIQQSQLLEQNQQTILFHDNSIIVNENCVNDNDINCQDMEDDEEEYRMGMFKPISLVESEPTCVNRPCPL